MILYITISFINVVLHIFRSILVIKSSKLSASFWNCICYTFSAIVIKFIAEVDLMTAIMVQAFTNFFGCYVGMTLADKYINLKKTMKRLSLKIALSEPKYQCCYCGRTFIEKVAHRCNTGFRKRHFKWIDYEETATIH